jgi:hypothetical protein
MADTHVRREMSITHDDFLRTLPEAMGDIPHTVSGTRITSEEDGKRLEINLSQEDERDVGSLELPVTFVDMNFSGFSEQQINEFFKRFDRYYQRGGG